MPTALITGASRGLGRALARALDRNGWTLVVDARDRTRLSAVAGELANVTAVAGDVADPAHRDELAREVRRLGRLDALVNNAGTLGVSPLPGLDLYPADELERVFRINTMAPLALLQLVLPELRASRGAVINVTSDAAVEAYAGWGGYGASKAALDQLSHVLGEELPSIDVYAFDPGDMRTDMHQRAYPGEDISDRPEPESAVPAILRLIGERPKSGRYRAADLIAPAGAQA